MPVPSAMLTVALLSKDVALMSNNGESSADETGRRWRASCNTTSDYPFPMQSKAASSNRCGCSVRISSSGLRYFLSMSTVPMPSGRA